MTVVPMRAITVRHLADWVRLIEVCYCHDLDGYGVVTEHVEDALEYFDVPMEWRAIVRVMAQGADYYGEGVWRAKHVDPASREPWMDEYWHLA
jgi:hypothetical protein